MKVNGVFVEALGSYLPPPTPLSEVVAAGLFDQAVAEETGQISVLIAGDEAPPDMAVAAARQALQRCGRQPYEVDALVHSSVFMQGPEMWTPPGYILRELGTRDIPGVELRQGCNGMLAAMELAVLRLLTDERCRIVLLTAGDNLNSPLFDRWRANTALFGADGGTAVVVAGSGFASIDSINSAVFPEIEGMARGAEPLFPPRSATGQPFDLVERMEYYAQTVRPHVETIELIRKAQLQVAQQSLDEAGVRLDEISRVIYVNGSRWLVNFYLAEPFGIPISRTAWEFGRTVGHMGASDQILSLDHLISSGELDVGDRVLLVGGAPGWSVTTTVLTITSRAPWLG